jgi:hypothetical protein
MGRMRPPSDLPDFERGPLRLLRVLGAVLLIMILQEADGAARARLLQQVRWRECCRG